MAIAFLSTLAVQIGSAYFNNFRSKKHAQEMARKQQAYEDKVARDGIENARTEFAELCAFQRDMEVEMQKDRLNLIRSNHENSLIQAAYETSLGSWPLMVPPYVIKNDTILSNGQSSEKAIPLNCILTTSTDSKFNKAVFYKIEEALACFCSKYWNISANKSIRFFQESWRDNFKDVGVKHKDLYAHLSDVPTLVISPVIKSGKLIFRFYWWGLSPDPKDAHLDDVANVLDPKLSVNLKSGLAYSPELTDTILNECTPKLEAFISYFADLYYWNYYKLPPVLPSLLKSSCLSLSDYDLREYRSEYSKQLTTFCESQESVTLSPFKTAAYISSLAGFATPPQDYCDCIMQFIKNRTSLSDLNCRDLDVLRSIQDCNISVELNQLVTRYIRKIEENEEVGLVPCIGRNELFQSLLNYANEIGSDYANISPINEISSLVEFFDEHGRLLSSTNGYRDFLFVYPQFQISCDSRFYTNTCTLRSTNKNNTIISKEVILSELESILSAQKSFIANLSNTFDRLGTDLWSGEIDLIDLKYDDLKSIFKHLLESVDSADYGYVVIGYSSMSDNYYFSAYLLKNNAAVGDSFVCRSNSLDKKIRTKLNHKSILKIQIK